MCARANARCNDNTDALSHAHTFTQPRIEHRLRSLSEFNDPSTRPSRAPPHHRSQSFPSPTPRAHSRSRVPQHTTFYLSLTSRVFFVSRSLPPPRRPPPFSFYNAGYISPLLTPILPSSAEHLIAPPYRTPSSFFSFGSPFPPSSRSFLYSLPRFRPLPVPPVLSFWPPSFPPVRFPLDGPPPPLAHWSTGTVHRAALVCYSRSFPSSFTIFHASATHYSVQSNGSARVQRLRGEKPEGGGARERERPPFSRPQRGMGYRGPIMDLSVGCCRWCLLLLALLQLPSVFRRHRVRRRAGRGRGGNVGWDRIESVRDRASQVCTAGPAEPEPRESSMIRGWNRSREADRDSVRAPRPDIPETSHFFHPIGK